MYSFTEHAKLPTILALCQCKRQFLVEEMYACFNCSYGFCRYCCVEEIQSYYCKNCLENTPYSSDIFGLQDTCTRCLECPNCLNNLNIIATSDTTNKDKIWLYYQCNNCFWDSKTIGIIANKLEDLLDSVRRKIRENIDPKNAEFNSIVAKYKGDFAELESSNVQLSKIKKKSVSLLLAKNLMKKSDISVKSYWSVNDAEKASNEVENQNLTKMTTLNLGDKKTLNIMNPGPKEEEGQIKNAVYKDLYNEEFESLDAALGKADTYNQECTMEQRISHPTLYQPDPQQLFPLPVRLLPKRIRKCKKCMKNVVKPHSASIVSSDFQLLTLLAGNFPKLTISKIANFNISPEAQIAMNFYNKTRNALRVEILPLEPEQAQNLELSEYTLTSRPAFSISSPMMPESDPEKLGQKQSFVEEVQFKLQINPDKSGNMVQFGFNVNSSIEIESDKIVLKIPIIIKLGKAPASS